VRIVGNVARTEIEEVFRNDSDHTLEGIYRFPLPPDAQIARLALDVDGALEEGAFVERDRAAQIWRGVIRNATPRRQRDDSEEFIWVPGPWRDPAILQWQRGGQFELRIFPIPAHGERRVVLAYTQNVQPQGERRRYVYPLAHSADDSTRVERFDLDVRVAGAERVTASGYRVTSADDEGATRLSLSREGFRPKGDLVIDYELPGGERELRWWTYRGEAAVAPPENSRQRDREVLDRQRRLAEDARPYVAFALRPRLPRAAQRENRDYLLVVDASQSMVGERYHRAARLTTHLVAEMDRRDRFAILACDTECRAMPGGLQPPSARAAREAREWLDAIEPAGASDLTAVLREAVAAVGAERRDERELHLMYVGDGTSTVGYRRASFLAAETEQLARDEGVVVSTVGIGGDADTLALRAMARAGRGHYAPYVPGQRISVAALSVLETTYGASLESPRVELPDGLSDVAPASLPTIRAGQEVLLVGRMDADRVQGDLVLRGTVAGRPFEQRYAVDLVPTEAAGNRFVPRLWAAQRIEQLQLSGRGEERARIVALSKAFGVLSRHTSLLVLESEAMFRAFRVDRREASHDWTGEEDVVAGEAEGQLGIGGLAFGGTGRGGGAVRERRARRARGPARPSASGSSSRALTAADALSAGGGGGGAARAEARSEITDGFGEPSGAWSWPDMPAPDGDRAPPQARPRPLPTPRRRPGRWMRRERYRAARIRGDGDASRAARRAADEAEEALEANPDSRDRHREAVRRLARADRLERALEVAEAWIARDRLDPEALTAKADLLGRLGHRDEALRLLTGTVDLAPNEESLHARLAAAFERAGRPERACAHRIALAEIDEDDPDAVAAAMRCERQLGRDGAAERLLSSLADATVRTRAERRAASDEDRRPFRGDFTVEAEWSGEQDLDLSIVTRRGTRLSWMGGRTTVTGEHAREAGREGLGLRWTAPGTYIVEVSRTDPSDREEVSGELTIRVLGQRRTVPFTLRGAREPVARIRVTRQTRLVPVTGTVRR
jgi:Mg-chelatase subunit ChlD